MEKDGISSTGSGQIKLVLAIFAALTAVLIAGYFLFLRTEYSVLFSDLRTEDAAAIVAELDSKGIGYELRDGGSTILVPTEQASAVRLAVAGSAAATRGMVGFELFNESDMGLTDFAQRINYQRALQGELARTIMMMDGIDNARVHLALPERTLFRGNRSEPKAAVTVMARRGSAIDEARVLGIQRLVAAAVPDLSLNEVAVLDEHGRVLSASAAQDPLQSPEMEGRNAVQQYFRARVRSAVQAAMPGLRFDVRVLIPAEAAVPGLAGMPEGLAGPGARDFPLRLVVMTEEVLPAPDQTRIRSSVAEAAGLNEGAGDSLVFTVAALDVARTPSLQSSRPGTSVAPIAPAVREESDPWLTSWWIMVAAVIGLALVVLGTRLRGTAVSTEERDAFAARLRLVLGSAEGGDEARARIAAELLALPGARRRAILDSLTAAERSKVNALLAEAEPFHLEERAPRFSPWLEMRVQEAAGSAGDGADRSWTMTPATRDLLRLMPQDASARAQRAPAPANGGRSLLGGLIDLVSPKGAAR